MTVKGELSTNKALSGPEAKEILLQHFRHLLDNDCSFVPTVAYARLAFEIRYTLHTGNFIAPQHTMVARSKPLAGNLVAADPKLAAIESGPPLADPPADSYVSAQETSVSVVSPNAARVEHGLPVTVVRRDNNGEFREEGVHYSAEDAAIPAAHASTIIETDISDVERARLGLGVQPKGATT